jgi:hypothetical protein
MTTGSRRPRRSNSALDIVRGIRTQKVIYWTQARLLALLRRVTRNKREEWFAARIAALKSWPERTPEQILDSASRIDPRRLIHGRWSWPKSQLAVEWELVPLPEGLAVDTKALRAELEGMDTRTGADGRTVDGEWTSDCGRSAPAMVMGKDQTGSSRDDG